MAVPKKKTSVSRKGLRRAGQHHKEYRVHSSNCSNCSAMVLPHRACSSCGQYKGREVFAIKVREVEEDYQATEE